MNRAVLSLFLSFAIFMSWVALGTLRMDEFGLVILGFGPPLSFVGLPFASFLWTNFGRDNQLLATRLKVHAGVAAGIFVLLNLLMLLNAPSALSNDILWSIYFSGIRLNTAISLSLTVSWIIYTEFMYYISANARNNLDKDRENSP